MRARLVHFVLAFMVFAYSFWFNLLGTPGAMVLLGVATSATAVAWVIARRRGGGRLLRVRGFPWAPLAYVALALISIVWSRWPSATMLTWWLLAAVTLLALYLADSLTPLKLIAVLEVALAAVVVLSLCLEMYVSLRGDPLLPNFSDAPKSPDPHWNWVRGNLLNGVFTGGRVQGIVGNANLLAVLCLLSVTITACRMRDPGPARPARLVVILISGWLFIRCDSATMWIAAVLIGLCAIFLLGWLGMTWGSRRAVLILSAVVGITSVGALVIFRDSILAVLGKNATLTGRVGIWEDVLKRAGDSPVLGNGFSTPWVPWDERFSGWISDHGIVVFQAHNLWLDVLMQLGIVGVFVMLGVFAVAWVRAVSAVGRGNGDPVVVRVAPLLLLIVLSVQSLTESNPGMLWGWMMLTLLNSGLTRSPRAETHAFNDS